MNLLVERGIIEEMECGANFAYVIKDNDSFSLTEYKVLQSQTHNGFVKCMKMLHNGKIELYYFVETYKPLSQLLSNLYPDHFITVVENLLAGIINVKNNGFLCCNNIDSSIEHIYVDQNTFKVGLIYLPLDKHEYGDIASFENAIRSELVRVITETPTLMFSKTNQLRNNLQNDMMSVEDVYHNLCGKRVCCDSSKQRQSNKDSTPASTMNSIMKLIALNAPTSMEILIKKPDFSIGKNDKNDGVVRFNNKISRFHCKITVSGQQFMIIDLKSANGTTVNGVRLTPNKPFLLMQGDLVCLADSEFKVVIE